MAGTGVSKVLAVGSLALLGCASSAPPAGTAIATASATAAAGAPGGPASASAPTVVPTAVTSPTGSAVPAGSAPPAGSTAPIASATPTAAPTASAPPKVTYKARASFDEPTFEGGDVPKAKETLEKFAKAVEKCVDEGGGIGDKGASIKIQFLVRAKGIAEGIDVLGATGLEEKPGKCVRDVFKKKAIGTPSADPVGVTFTITFQPRTEK
ncbi:MAG: hypothetical protein U0414_13130 [Polyangiaceae bacterium]